MFVRFATLCDDCGDRSEEYTQSPTCRDCQSHICETCAEPGTLVEDEGIRTVVCPQCWQDYH